MNFRLYVYIFLVTILFNMPLMAQDHPDKILIGDKEVPKVMVIGTFHFGYPNLDAHKIAKEDQLDILSDQKQREVEELVAYIAQYKPTKIVVEAGQNTGYLMRRYDRWITGEETLAAKEIDQLGFRLMKQFEIDTLYGCDADGLTSSMAQHKDSLCLETYVTEIFEDYDWSSDDPMDEAYTRFYDYDTQLSLDLPLLDYFKYLNNDDVVKRYHGAYLIGDFKLDNNRGADALALYWYSRNLRTFRKIQQIEAGPDDRVLVLFGAGHSSILKQQFEATPEFELIEFNELNSFKTDALRN